MSVISPPRRGSTDGPPPPPPQGGSPAPGAQLPPSPPPPAEAPARRRRWGWGRLLLGALIVVLCAGGASAVFVVEQVHTLKVALGQNKSLNIAPNVLASAGWGQPETLLLVGDDWRPKTKYYAVPVPHLANEMLLVRLDPSKPYISMMSIPRELLEPIYDARGQQVAAPTRLNFAYHFGAGALAKTIQIDLGLSVNHVVVATFGSFERAVDEMGCVYSTVDQRYYHVNVPGGQQYQEINLQPGYQRLCGHQAEEFVSYRHTDTSLVRDARDQSFLLDVKKQYGPTLVDNVGKFERIFGRAVRTDAGLDSTNEIINLLGTLIKMSGESVRQVHFQANLQPTGANPCSCDTATPQQIRDSVNAFLNGGSPIPKQRVAAQAQAVHSKRGAAQLPLTPTPSSAQAQARAAALKLGAFPLEYPQVEDRSGSVQAPSLRVYRIEGPDRSLYAAYVVVFYGGQLGAYYDVQGTTWTTAPQFDSPDQTVRVGDRTYYLYYDGSKLRMVAWYEHRAVYWVRNSLTDSLANGEMLAIAEQTVPFVGVHATPTQPRVILRDASVPTRIVHKTPLTLKQKVGGVAALVTLVALPLLAFLGLRRIIEVRGTRRYVLSGGERGRRPPGPHGLNGLPLARNGLDRLGAGGLGGPAVAGAGAGAAGGSSFADGSAAAGSWLGDPAVYRDSWLRRPRAIAAIVVVLLLAAGGAAAAWLLTRHHAAPVVHRVKRPARPAVPTVPVVVLNATQTPGAAHREAVLLKAHRVKVSGVGNLSQTLPPGNEILYAPGERRQAERLNHLLPGQASTVAPMDPLAAGAAGSHPQLVFVIT